MCGSFIASVVYYFFLSFLLFAPSIYVCNASGITFSQLTDCVGFFSKEGREEKTHNRTHQQIYLPSVVDQVAAESEKLHKSIAMLYKKEQDIEYLVSRWDQSIDAKATVLCQRIAAYATAYDARFDREFNGLLEDALIKTMYRSRLRGIASDLRKMIDQSFLLAHRIDTDKQVMEIVRMDNHLFYVVQSVQYQIDEQTRLINSLNLQDMENKIFSTSQLFETIRNDWQLGTCRPSTW